MKKILPLLALLALSACGPSFEESPEMKAYIKYRQERVLVKICVDGTRIYSYNHDHYAESLSISQAKVAGPQVCN